MKLTKEEVLHIAKLARLGVSDEDVARFQEQLSNILENFESLQKVDTSDIPPTAQPNPLQNILKEDLVKPSLAQEDVLANAPKREGEFFRVKAVLEE
jgi:aspartyl-tRNA(Asn)/glutamyl-tRNA(Gln) amidotransferase subunit C